MSTTVEHTTTTSSSSSVGIGVDRAYLCSYLGIIKLVEIVLDIAAFICASVWINWVDHGGGWVQFVTMSAFVSTLLLFLFRLFRINYRLPRQWGLIVFVYYVLYSFMMLSAGIVCVVRYRWHTSIGAAAFFTFAAAAVYIVDTFFMYRICQSGRFESSSQTTTTTKTTKETHETKVQY